ncbi:MAG: adenylate/guanylate cyclase domain-containing protein [Elusimicrobiota bacterium]
MLASISRWMRRLADALHLTPDRLWLYAYGVVPTLLLACSVGLWWINPPVLRDLRSRVFDSYQRLRPRPYRADAPVRIIDIDDASLERVGQWPWPRTKLAKLIRRLGEGGAGVVVFDVVFAEPDRTSPALIASELPQTDEFRFFRDRLKDLPDHDKIFAQAIAEGTVVTGYSLVPQTNAARPQVKAGYLFASKVRDGGPVITAEELSGREREDRNIELDIKQPEDYIPEDYGGAVVALPLLEQRAAGNGNFSNTPDRDGVIRRVPMMFKLDGVVYPSLSAEAIRAALGSRGYKVRAGGGHGEWDYGAGNGIITIEFGQVPVAEGEAVGLTAPTDAEGKILLYDSGHKPQRFVPAWKVLDDRAWKDLDKESLLAGRIVFLGTSAAGLKDQRATPLNQTAPGVEVHAQIVEQVFLQQFLRRPVWANLIEFYTLLLLGIVLIAITSRLGAAMSAVIAGAGIAAAGGASWYAFTEKSLLLDPVFPSIVVFAVYISSSLINYLRTEAERKHIQLAFGRYMSPALVEQLARDSSKLELGGETREMTLMFSDIRGFTTISEQFDAHGLTQFINAYLTPMTNIVLDHKGTIDKYMGDCIMAFWNAPLTDEQHAANACRAALSMRERLLELNEQWARDAEKEGRKYIPIRAGIGLNSGQCCVGNMGSDLRQEYSVLGDDVNLASRLEGQSKSYGVEIVIGDNTRRLVPEFAAVELDLIKVKGKTVPVHIFTLLGDEALARTDKFKKFAQTHAALIAAYRGQQWEAAEAAVDALRYMDFPLEKLYDLYLERIAACRKSPPGGDWDGVFTATSK